MSESNERLENGLVALFALPKVDYERVIDSNQRAMLAAFEAQGHGLRHMARIGGSVMEFVQRRLRQDTEAAQRLGGCSTPADAYLVCHDFMDAAIDDYAAEFGTLAALYADQGREAMHDLEHEADEYARPALNVVG